MTVQELIDLLNAVVDKSMPVRIYNKEFEVHEDIMNISMKKYMGDIYFISERELEEVFLELEVGS